MNKRNTAQRLRGEVAPLLPEEQQEILDFQQAILRSVLGDGDSASTVADICRLAEMLLPDSVGSVMLLNRDDGLLHMFAAPSVPRDAAQRLNFLRPGPGGGSCGNVIHCGTPQYVDDTFHDPRWSDLRPIAQDLNIRSCWSVPVVDGQGSIIGTFALSSFEHRMPGSFHRKLLDTGAALVGIILSHARWQDSLRLYGKAFDSAEEGMLITDAQRRIVAVNASMAAILGYRSDELLGKTPMELSAGLHDKDFHDAMWHAVRTTGAWSGETWNRRKNGEVYPEWRSIKAIRGSDGGVINYLGVFTDLTQTKAAENAIQHLSTHDAQTGLPNRVLFRAGCESLVHSGAQGALLCLNIDDFRSINETLGLGSGDHILREVAARLSGLVGNAESVCRWSADEFLVMTSSAADLDSVANLCLRISEALCLPIEIDGHQVRLTVSQGVAQFPADGTNFDDLLRRATTALQDAKRAGKNIVRYATAHANDTVRAHFQIAQDLRRALAQKEFELHYQPQICLRTGRVVGAEGLIRWRDPKRGLVPPGVFIGAAERTGLIVDIGAWVIEQACADAARWRTLGAGDIRLSVNVSAIQTRRDDFCTILTGALARHGIAAKQLDLELTESVFMEDSPQMRAMLESLKRTGVQLSIDDFGTGYSSLAYLRWLAVNRLKIDRTFVGGLRDGADTSAIVQAVIGLGHAMNLAVVAEGVEDEQTLRQLQGMGCDEAQGFFFDAALPASQFEQRLLATAPYAQRTNPG